MSFASGQQISLRPDESIDTDLPIYIRSVGGLHTCRPVGLLLKKNEAINVLTQYTSTSGQPSPSLSEDLKIELFLLSNGHAGILIDLADILSRVPVSIPL
jgi:hypothetical protein